MTVARVTPYESRLLRTIASRDRRIERLVKALDAARAEGFLTAYEEGPAVVLSTIAPDRSKDQ